MLDDRELRAVLVIAAWALGDTAKLMEPGLEVPLHAAAEAFNLMRGVEPNEMRAIADTLERVEISPDGLEAPIAFAVPFIARSLRELADDLILAHR